MISSSFSSAFFLFVFELYDIGIELLLIYRFPALPEFFFFFFFFLPVTTLAFIFWMVINLLWLDICYLVMTIEILQQLTNYKNAFLCSFLSFQNNLSLGMNDIIQYLVP